MTSQFLTFTDFLCAQILSIYRYNKLIKFMKTKKKCFSHINPYSRRTKNLGTFRSLMPRANVTLRVTWIILFEFESISHSVNIILTYHWRLMFIIFLFHFYNAQICTNTSQSFRYVYCLCVCRILPTKRLKPYLATITVIDCQHR